METKQITITKDMTIGDVISKYPASIEPLQSAGVQCVGCHVAFSESLEQGLKGHGFDDAKVEEVLAEINKSIAETDNVESKDFIITKKASEKLVEVLKENDVEGSGLRIDVVPGGCSGYEYGLELDDNVDKSDIVVEENGAKIIINNEHKDFLKGAKLDYVESLQGGGFKITNPNATSGCGCGQSFSQ
tara:strand:- start:20917 stop:21480 length:564 start_codon:yes stop_codon:yes gene_type:complete